MQSHIGYICRIFHQSEFSNASLNCLHGQTQRYICCICMICRQSEFSSAFSNQRCKDAQMQRYIGCICLLFHQSEFLNGSQIDCLDTVDRCKIALVTFVGFFSRVNLQVRCQITCPNRANSHWLHNLFFARVSLHTCLFKSLAWTDC